jgi:type IV fimbrial biogenesis protein FimT
MEIQHMGRALGHRAPARPIHPARTRGFSLIELMMTIAVAVILMMIAIPSFQYVTNANRVSSEINGLLGDLQFARAEAIKEGQTVTVCIMANSTTCAGAGASDWQVGWIVFSDPTGGQAGGTALRMQSQFSSSDTLVGENGANALTAISFNRDGYAVGLATPTLLTLHTSPVNNAWTRCASLSTSGEVITEIYNVTNDGATCQ